MVFLLMKNGKNYKKIKDVILYGSDEEEIKFNYDDGMKNIHIKKLLKV